MSEIAQLTPRIVWDYFDQITRIPRPSKKEEKIMAYLVDFAKSHGLEYRRDGVGNLVIRKPATEGMEDRSTVVLQSHVDMVCEKNSSVNFDFEKDPIQTRIADGLGYGDRHDARAPTAASAWRPSWRCWLRRTFRTDRWNACSR